MQLKSIRPLPELPYGGDRKPGDRGGHATIRRRAGWFILSRTKDGKGAHSQNASEGPRRWVSEDFRD
jgi:hypothetical protein